MINYILQLCAIKNRATLPLARVLFSDACGSNLIIPIYIRLILGRLRHKIKIVLLKFLYRFHGSE